VHAILEYMTLAAAQAVFENMIVQVELNSTHSVYGQKGM